jgi:hypothetical protein
MPYGQVGFRWWASGRTVHRGMEEVDALRTKDDRSLVSATELWYASHRTRWHFANFLTHLMAVEQMEVSVSTVSGYSDQPYYITCLCNRVSACIFNGMCMGCQSSSRMNDSACGHDACSTHANVCSWCFIAWNTIFDKTLACSYKHLICNTAAV